MEFFDCNASYGLNYTTTSLYPVPNKHSLLAEMERAGIRKAMVWRKEQLHGGPAEEGNKLLSGDIQGEENLYGIWSIVPCQTHEIPEPESMASEMKRNRAFAWQLFPESYHFLPKAFALKEWLALAVRNSIPVYMNPCNGMSLDAIAGLLEKFPELTVILSAPSVWPNDRLLRPFISEFPNVFLDTSLIITAGGIESFVHEYGAGRLLYSSGFPDAYFGANMLMIRQARISPESMEAIASGNMEAIIGRIQL